MKRPLARFAKARAAGMPRRGWKVAINVPEVLKLLDLPHSGVGWLDGDHVPASGDVFTSPPNAQLLIEPEMRSTSRLCSAGQEALADQGPLGGGIRQDS